MITLITGTPGSGKTAYALDMMIRLQKLDNARPLYVHGIPDLKVPHEIVVCDSKTCDYCSTLENRDEYRQAKDWHIWAQQGAILFFDEVQNIHRPRHSSAPVPDCVAAYEVHRHKGLDFFMITQNPSLIDSNVRALVSRHIHLTATWARRIQHEWSQCKTDVSSTNTESIKSNYTLPKDVFKLYKSASLHTTVTRKKPLVLFLLPIFLIVAGFFIYPVIQRHSETKSEEKPIETPANEVGAGRGAQATHPAPTSSPQSAPVSVSHTEVLDFPKLFKKWSQLGIADDELKYLPISMCSVSSMRSVKCKFSPNLSFKNFFSNVSCTPDFCITFLSRIPAIPQNNESISPITLSSNL